MKLNGMLKNAGVDPETAENIENISDEEAGDTSVLKDGERKSELISYGIGIVEELLKGSGQKVTDDMKKEVASQLSGDLNMKTLLGMTKKNLSHGRKLNRKSKKKKKK